MDNMDEEKAVRFLENKVIQNDILDKTLIAMGLSLPEATQTEKTQIELGVAVEKEHKDIWDLFKKFVDDNKLEMPLTEEDFYKKIAEAHLKELPDYYTKLAKMEKGE